MTAQNMAFVLVKGAESLFGKELSFRVALFAVATFLYRANIVTGKDYTAGDEHQWPSYESYWKEVELLIIAQKEKDGKKEGEPGYYTNALQHPAGEKGTRGNTSASRDEARSRPKDRKK